MDGETESGPAALQGFCLLKSLLTSLSWMERVVTEVGGGVGGGGTFKVGIGGGAQTPAEEGEVEVEVIHWSWSCWEELWGMVAGLSLCLSKRQ